MNTNGVLLGYEVGTGEPVELPFHHLCVTGITQLSGKTTTLEALLGRAGRTALVFLTKRGERILPDAPRVAPYFREQSDWQYVSLILEATIRERLRMERATIIRVTKGTTTLQEVRDRCAEELENPRVRAFDRDMFTNLLAYLDIILPQLVDAPLVSTLAIEEGVVQVMDLSPYSTEVQVLIVRSVVEEVHDHRQGIILVIPEIHKFAPQRHGTPTKPALEKLIREGGALGNWVWLDGQDLAGTDKGILKQCDTWLLGRQREVNEAEHVVKQVPLPARTRPKIDEVMGLRLGHFFACFGDQVKHVYVLPAWLSPEKAIGVAKGTMELDEPPASLAAAEPPDEEETYTMTAELEELLREEQEKNERLLRDLLENEQELANTRESLKKNVEIARTNETAAKMVLALGNALAPFITAQLDGHESPQRYGVLTPDDLDELAGLVAARLPAGTGQVIQMAPVPALQEVFQGNIRAELLKKAEAIITSVRVLPERSRKLLTVLGISDVPVPAVEAVRLLGSDIRNSGGAHTAWSAAMNDLVKERWVYRDPNKKGFKGRIALKVQEELAYWEPSEEDLAAVVHNVLVAAADGVGVPDA